ncbi:MAG: DUF1697 domain-containing protein [Acidimicrobiales bacterium]|nr:DUF1697 domain-containing protein [Acidimicrobiales bacterium]
MSGTWQVAFLRAINVGRRRVAMADLLEALAPVGLDDAWTHIASGNVAFRSRRRASTLEPAIEAAVADALGFEAEAFVRSAARVRELATADPFGGRAEGTTHLVVLARSALDAEATRAVEGLSGPADRLVVDGADIHWRIEGKSMDSALTPKDWKATGIGPITNRNTTMLAKLADRLEG